MLSEKKCLDPTEKKGLPLTSAQISFLFTHLKSKCITKKRVLFIYVIDIQISRRLGT